MEKSISQLLREAAAALEHSTSDSPVSVSASSAPSPSIIRTSDGQGFQGARSEVSRLFAPYAQSRVGSRKRSCSSALPAKKLKTITYTHRFFCLSKRRDCEVPTPSEKMKLERADLGGKKIVFPDKYCQPEDFTEYLYKQYPKLKDAGGYELLKIRGATRSKSLEIIPCPDEGYSAEYLSNSTLGIGVGVIYIRPLQKNLSLEDTCKNSEGISGQGPQVPCLYCQEKNSVAEMQKHVDQCEMLEGVECQISQSSSEELPRSSSSSRQDLSRDSSEELPRSSRQDLSRDSSEELPRSSRQDLSRDSSRQDLSRDSSRQGLSRDSSRQDLSRDSSRQGLSRDSSRQGLSRDSSRQGLSRDSSRQGLSRDSSRQDLSRDSSRQDLSRDSSRQDLSRDSSRQDLSRDSSDELPRSSTHDFSRDSSRQDLSRDSSDELPRSSTHDFSRDSSRQDLSRDSSDELPRSSTHDFSRDSSDELPRSSTHDFSRDSSDELPRSSSRQQTSRSSIIRQEIDQSREARDRDNEEWKVEPNLFQAAFRYRRGLLESAERLSAESLTAGLNLCSSTQEREREMFTFYKSQTGNWARPFFVILRGDAAIGDGVKRYFLSQVISRVQFGFTLDFDNCGKTLFFTGQEDHLVPSTSRSLLDSDLFRIVGRMIGHSFINGGPLLTGLSPAMFGIITGQMNETVIIELEDCPDTDVIDIVHLLQKPNTLSDDERAKVNDLAVSWDLPRVTVDNRLWLAQSILHHAVIGRREKQMQQLKKGLKDTGVLRMVKERPSLIEVLFPRSSSLTIDAQMILEKVFWPNPDSDDEENFSLETCCRITSYFRQYIEQGTPQDLKNLVEFWVGWTSLPQELYVEVSSDIRMPTASTCRETLKLPLHYNHYEEFSSDLNAAVSSNTFGFGLV